VDDIDRINAKAREIVGLGSGQSDRIPRTTLPPGSPVPSDPTQVAEQDAIAHSGVSVANTVETFAQVDHGQPPSSMAVQSVTLDVREFLLGLKNYPIGDTAREAIDEFLASAAPPEPPLDVPTLGRAIHRVFRHGVHGPGRDDGDVDLAAAILDEYSALHEEPSLPQETDG